MQILDNLQAMLVAIEGRSGDGWRQWQSLHVTIFSMMSARDAEVDNFDSTTPSSSNRWRRWHICCKLMPAMKWWFWNRFMPPEMYLRQRYWRIAANVAPLAGGTRWLQGWIWNHAETSHPKLAKTTTGHHQCILDDEHNQTHILHVDGQDSANEWPRVVDDEGVALMPS